MHIILQSNLEYTDYLNSGTKQNVQVKVQKWGMSSICASAKIASVQESCRKHK